MALEHLKKSTLPWDDNKELVQLVIVCVIGHIKNFYFIYPGAEHHAKWISKAMNFMKLLLLLFYIDIVIQHKSVYCYI